MRKRVRAAGGLKAEILRVAGRLFREHGYDKTTFRMIADELDIAPSAIAYHFKAKSYIVRELFTVCRSILREYVTENLAEGFNYYLLNGIVEISFFREVMKNERIWTLFNRRDNLEFLSESWLATIKDGLWEVTDNFQKDFNEKEIHAAAVMSVGARISLFKEFTHNKTMSIDEYCYYFVYLAGVLSRLDEASIQRNIRRAFEFADSHQFPKTPLFEDFSP